MRVLVITAGSRGDVAPCTGRGRRLPDADHQVAAAVHPSFAAPVGGCGLGHRPVPGDPQGLLRDRARATSPEAARALTRAYADRLADGVAQAVAGGADLLLTAFGPAPLSRTAGEALGVPRHRHLPRTGVRRSPPDGSRCPTHGAPTARDRRATSPRAGMRCAEGVFAGAVTQPRARLDLPAGGRWHVVERMRA